MSETEQPSPSAGRPREDEAGPPSSTEGIVSPARTGPATESEGVGHAAAIARRAVVVLGMHRSGTSCLAGSLVHGLGNTDGLRHHAENSKGHFEERSVVALNDAVLQASGTTWRDPPTTLRPESAMVRTRDQLVSSWNELGWVVVKDPRMPLTWPFWEPALGACPAVITIRHPSAVVDSSLTRGDLSPQRVLRLWLATYRVLLEQARRRAVPVVVFGVDAATYRRQICSVLETWRTLGWSEAADAVDFDKSAKHVDPNLVHHVDVPLDAQRFDADDRREAHAIYDELFERSRLVREVPRKRVESPHADDWRQHLDAAQRAHDASDGTSTLMHFARAAASSPDPDAIRQRAVRSAISLGLHAEALELTRQALEQVTNRSWWLVLQADALEAARRPEEALACVESCLSLEPNNARAMMLRVGLLMRLGRWVEGLAASRAIPRDAGPVYVIEAREAECAYRCGDFAGGQEAAERARAAAPAEKRGWIETRCGLALFEAGHADAAETYLLAAIAAPDAPIAAFLRVIAIARRRGDVAFALECAERAHSQHPHHPQPIIAAADLARSARMLDDATAWATKLSALAPDGIDVDRIRAQIEFDRGAYELAAKHARPWVDRANTVQAWRLHALCQERLGNAPEALLAWRRVFELDPKDQRAIRATSVPPVGD